MKIKGFTLAEVIITLAIVGVIAAISIPQISIMTERHKSSAIVSKIVNTFEVGCKNMFDNYNMSNDSSSNVDKILLVGNDWNKLLAKEVGLKAVGSNTETSWLNLIIAPVYAGYTNYNRTNNGIVTEWSATNDSFSGNGTCVSTMCSGTITSSDGAEIPVNFTTSGSSSSQISNTCSGSSCTNLYPGSNSSSSSSSSSSGNSGQQVPMGSVIPIPEEISDINLDTEYKVGKIPGVIKMVTVGAVESNKYNPDAQIVLIYIDTNGFNNKDKMGVDQFSFALTNNGKMVPFGEETEKFVKNGYRIK